MDPLTALALIRKGVKTWLMVRPIRRIRKWRNKETEVFKGKLTYASLAVVAAPMLGALLGMEIAETELVQIAQGVAVLIGFYGRWRATRG